MPGPTWVFDTSALIAIKSKLSLTDRVVAFAAMGHLVGEGRLKFPRQVLVELSPHKDQAQAWVKIHSPAASEGEPTLFEVRAVLKAVPDILDPAKDSGEDEADPYVLAMALKLIDSGVAARVVTEESRDYPTKLSLNTAAGILGIPSVPLKGFLRAEDIL